MTTIIRDNERVRLARTKLKVCKATFSSIAAAALSGKADPEEATQAMRAVTEARRELQAAERDQ